LGSTGKGRKNKVLTTKKGGKREKKGAFRETLKIELRKAGVGREAENKGEKCLKGDQDQVF